MWPPSSSGPHLWAFQKAFEMGNPPLAALSSVQVCPGPEHRMKGQLVQSRNSEYVLTQGYEEDQGLAVQDDL